MIKLPRFKLLVRRLHKWTGLVLGAQLLIWTISGAVMAWLDHHDVSGEHTSRRLPEPAMPDQLLTLAQLKMRLDGPVHTLSVRPLLGRHVFEAQTPGGVRLLDAIDGQDVSVDSDLAVAIARAGYAGSGNPAGVHLIAKPTLETRTHALPLWRVDFSDPEKTSLYVSKSTGQIVERRNDTWRLFDVFWMLHIMDYTDRQSFNHPLVIAVAAGAGWLSVTGVFLLFQSFRRDDFRLRRKGSTVVRVS